MPQPGDRMWTPADWAWAGGLLDVLLPALSLGVPVVAKKFDKFDPQEAFALMADAEVRNAFIPPTALRMLRSAGKPREKLRLRTLGSGGESLGEETYAWGAGDARAHHQRILRPDRMQPRALVRGGDRRQQSRCDREARAGSHGRGNPRRTAAFASRANSARSR